MVFQDAANDSPDGLYRIDPSTLACTRAPFGAHGTAEGSSSFAANSVLGMAFVMEPTGTGERLYFVAEGYQDWRPSLDPDAGVEPLFFLGQADPPTFAWSPTAWFQVNPLLGFSLSSGEALTIVGPPMTVDAGSVTEIYGVKTESAALTEEYTLPIPFEPLSNAFFRRAGDYYVLPSGYGGVYRFRPTDGSWTLVAQIPEQLAADNMTPTNPRILVASTAACSAD
jgi:hypothetical protein